MVPTDLRLIHHLETQLLLRPERQLAIPVLLLDNVLFKHLKPSFLLPKSPMHAQIPRTRREEISLNLPFSALFLKLKPSFGSLIRSILSIYRRATQAFNSTYVSSGMKRPAIVISTAGTTRCMGSPVAGEYA